jgi:hypothetical protein
VAHIYNPSYLGGRDWEDCSLRSTREWKWGQLARLHLNKMSGMAFHACHPSNVGVEVGAPQSRPAWAKNVRPYLKNN